MKKKSAQQIALEQKFLQKRKSNPKLVVREGDQSIVFEKPVPFECTGAFLETLKMGAFLDHGVYRTMLVAVEVLDGKANLVFSKVAEKSD